jgi:metallo-beta-lactamase class B
MKNQTSFARIFSASAISLAIALALAACASTTAPIAAPATPPSEATVAAHLAAADRAAGTDLVALHSLCNPPPAVKPPQAETEKAVAGLMALPAPPPGQAFDNLYYVGVNWVSAWAIKTSAGIILIDALDNADEAAASIDGGLRKLGMDPAQIKYVIVTHGHGDHYGGVDYLVQHYHPKIVMSAADWTMTETKLEFDMALWGRPPKRDVAAKDGDVITLGDTTVTLYITAGHTMGAISPVFDVKANGQTHRVVLWGGTAFNFGKDLPRLDSYVASTQRISAVVKQQGIDVLISNHAGFDGSLKKLDQRRAAPGAPNPFVMGTPDVLRALTVMGECAAATRDRFMLQP